MHVVTPKLPFGTRTAVKSNTVVIFAHSQQRQTVRSLHDVNELHVTDFVPDLLRFEAELSNGLPLGLLDGLLFFKGSLAAVHKHFFVFSEVPVTKLAFYSDTSEVGVVAAKVKRANAALVPEKGSLKLQYLLISLAAIHRKEIDAVVVTANH